MSMQPAVQPRSAVNGYGRRRNEKDVTPRLDNKPQTGKANLSRLGSVGEIADTVISLFILSVIFISNFTWPRQRWRK